LGNHGGITLGFGSIRGVTLTATADPKATVGGALQIDARE
jgi:hypothetical protein